MRFFKLYEKLMDRTFLILLHEVIAAKKLKIVSNDFLGKNLIKGF